MTDGEIEMTKKPKVDPPSDDGEAPGIVRFYFCSDVK